MVSRSLLSHLSSSPFFPLQLFFHLAKLRSLLFCFSPPYSDSPCTWQTLHPSFSAAFSRCLCSPLFDWKLAMASKLDPNVLYVAEHSESLGSPQADSERTHIVSNLLFGLHLKLYNREHGWVYSVKCFKTPQIDLLCLNNRFHFHMTPDPMWLVGLNINCRPSTLRDQWSKTLSFVAFICLFVCLEWFHFNSTMTIFQHICPKYFNNWCYICVRIWDYTRLFFFSIQHFCPHM